MDRFWCKKCQKYHFDNSNIGIKHNKFSSGIKKSKRYRW